MGINHYLILCYKKPYLFIHLLNGLIMAKQANKIMFILDCLFDPLLLSDTYQVIIQEIIKVHQKKQKQPFKKKDKKKRINIRESLIDSIALMINNGLSDLILKIFIKHEKSLLKYDMHSKFAKSATRNMMINKVPVLIELLNYLSDTNKLLTILNSDQSIYGLFEQPNVLYFLMFHQKINKIKRKENVIIQINHNFATLVIFLLMLSKKS